jgi:hypothetical protein
VVLLRSRKDIEGRLPSWLHVLETGGRNAGKILAAFLPQQNARAPLPIPAGLVRRTPRHRFDIGCELDTSSIGQISRVCFDGRLTASPSRPSPNLDRFFLHQSNRPCLSGWSFDAVKRFPRHRRMPSLFFPLEQGGHPGDTSKRAGNAPTRWADPIQLNNIFGASSRFRSCYDPTMLRPSADSAEATRASRALTSISSL